MFTDWKHHVWATFVTNHCKHFRVIEVDRWLIEFNPYAAIPHKYLCGNIPDWQRAILAASKGFFAQCKLTLGGVDQPSINFD